MRRAQQNDLVLSGIRAYFEYLIRQVPGPGDMFLRNWIAEYERVLTQEQREALLKERVYVHKMYEKKEPEPPRRVIRADNGREIEL